MLAERVSNARERLPERLGRDLLGQRVRAAGHQPLFRSIDGPDKHP
jgi:hypothetical protein